MASRRPTWFPGTGIDDRSVSTGSLILLKDGVALVEGIDYRFAYNPSTNIIRLTPIAGVWEDDSTYLIRMIDSSDAIIRAADGVVYPDGETVTVIDELNVKLPRSNTTRESSSTCWLGLDATSADGLTDRGLRRIRPRGLFELDSNNADLADLNVAVPIPAAGDTEDFAAALGCRDRRRSVASNFTSRCVR